MSDTRMTCPSPDDLSAFHDGELAPSDRTRVETHVASCAACATALARIQRASSLLSALPREEASPELVREVAQQAAVGRRRPAKWHLMALPLASAAAMLALSFLLLRMTREETMQDHAPSTLEARMNDAKRGSEAGSLSATASPVPADAPADQASVTVELRTPVLP